MYPGQERIAFPLRDSMTESDVTQQAIGSDPTRALLRHLLATLAYRASKVLRDAPAGFDDFSISPSTRSPVLIVTHLGDLLEWALRTAKGEMVWRAAGSHGWNSDLERFFVALSALDEYFASGSPLVHSAETLIQGPLADALTHVGQLAMLRGVFGAPIRPESYGRAAIVAGSVGLDQPLPRREFDGDASVV